MTDEELKAVCELVYISRQIATTMAGCPDLTALEIAGAADDPDEALHRLLRAIDTVGRLAFPAWDHRHADEMAP
jgi:hypothetical protein